MAPLKMVTVEAPVNIAVIKYWGKADEDLIIPLNDSLSGTLSTDQMCAKTTVAFSPAFSSNRMWLNGKEETFKNQRLLNCLREIRKRAQEQGKLSPAELECNVHICSHNNFPTAAGLASSAAGYACLVFALSKLYLVDGDISSIARQGSGSACRSVYGGFVEWIAGKEKDGRDSIARQVVDANHWPQMHVLILVVSDHKKNTSSTNGMQTSRETSELLQHRISHSAPQRQLAMKNAIIKKDYQAFAEITMRDSNQFHAICQDTYPPLVYMNEISHSIVNTVHQINSDAGKTIVAYTFDAGPNACLYLLEDQIPLVLAALKHVFPFSSSEDRYYTGLPMPIDSPSDLKQKLPSIAQRQPWGQDSLRYVIHTKIGEGPRVLPLSDTLMKDDGSPLQIL